MRVHTAWRAGRGWDRERGYQDGYRLDIDGRPKGSLRFAEPDATRGNALVMVRGREILRTPRPFLPNSRNKTSRMTRVEGEENDSGIDRIMRKNDITMDRK